MATAMIQTSTAHSRSSSRRKTLSHADLEDFLCDLGTDNADENYVNELDQYSYEPGMGNCGQVEYTDEQRIRDIYKVTASSLPIRRR